MPAGEYHAAQQPRGPRPLTGPPHSTTEGRRSAHCLEVRCLGWPTTHNASTVLPFDSVTKRRSGVRECPPLSRHVHLLLRSQWPLPVVQIGGGRNFSWSDEQRRHQVVRNSAFGLAATLGRQVGRWRGRSDTARAVCATSLALDTLHRARGSAGPKQLIKRATRIAGHFGDLVTHSLGECSAESGTRSRCRPQPFRELDRAVVLQEVSGFSNGDRLDRTVTARVVVLPGRVVDRWSRPSRCFPRIAPALTRVLAYTGTSRSSICVIWTCSETRSALQRRLSSPQTTRCELRGDSEELVTRPRAG